MCFAKKNAALRSHCIPAASPRHSQVKDAEWDSEEEQMMLDGDEVERTAFEECALNDDFRPLFAYEAKFGTEEKFKACTS